ncbi:MAG: hypothetical protein K2P81_03375 [Bacteriovoracaceae bacterium]|nr:hypothetical protein [Bacteriovoracaceae bacterium]
MKQFVKIIPAIALVALVGCNDRYQEGFNTGRTQGYDAGYADGDADGYSRGEGYFATHTTYEHGYADGNASGLRTGYTQGYSVGLSEGKPIGFAQAMADGTYTRGYNNGNTAGYRDGYNDGYDDGDSDGYDDGFDDGRARIQTQITNAYNNGYNNGYDDGFDDGYVDGDYDGYNDGFDDGYDVGYDDGFDDGYDWGFDDGWDAALGFSVGAIKVAGTSARVELLNKVHNDLVNYKKIQAPKSTARGLEAHGRLIFEESSMSSKDLEKRAAATERYLVGEMGKQISAHFGLSQERALKVAKVSNLWRKYSSTRAITDEDANAFSEALIGVNLKEVERAVKESMKGETSSLNALLQQAAVVNGTSPENVSRIMNQVFF